MEKKVQATTKNILWKPKDKCSGLSRQERD